jgi:hypothetical protein
MSLITALKLSITSINGNTAGVVFLSTQSNIAISTQDDRILIAQKR